MSETFVELTDTEIDAVAGGQNIVGFGAIGALGVNTGALSGNVGVIIVAEAEDEEPPVKK